MALRVLIALSAVAVAATLGAADGHPDLSGTYDLSTLTPLERPPAYGDRLELSDEEAEAIAKREAELMAQANSATDPERDAPAEGGGGFAGDVELPELDAAAGNVGGYNLFWIDRGTGGFKINGKWRTSILTTPKNGRRPALTAEGKKRAAARAKLYRPNTGVAWWIEAGLNPGPYDDPEMRPLAERCLLGFGSTGGPPMLPVLYNNLKKIVQTEDTVMILVEMVHDARIVRIDGEHAPADVRKWLGDSVGRWEGDTLVVDTTNFSDSPALGGASRDLHVIERFTRIGQDTLLYQFTVDDPTIWTQPWSGEYTWRRTDSRIYEYACHEGNYSFGGILRGARLLESEAPGKSEE